MPEASLNPPALAFDEPAGRYRLRALETGHILQLVVVDAVALDAAGLAEPGAHAFRRAPGGDALLVGSAPLSAADVAAKQARLQGAGYLIDQTHGRVRLELSGPKARGVLSRGVGVDVADSAFPLGAVCETQYGQIGIHLTRTGADTFELLVGRSFAESLWREMTE